MTTNAPSKFVSANDSRQPEPDPPLKIVGAPSVSLQPITMAVAAQKAEPSISALSLELASDYKKLTDRFLAAKEVSLHAELYGNVRLVSLAPGRLEIEPLPGAPKDLAARVTKYLTEWTGDRWIVAIVRDSQAAQPTLAEQSRNAAQSLRDEALADPIVQAALAAFPGAELKAIKPRIVRPQAEVEAPDDPAPSDIELGAELESDSSPDPADD